jgi:hypothetical protein
MKEIRKRIEFKAKASLLSDSVVFLSESRARKKTKRHTVNRAINTVYLRIAIKYHRKENIQSTL